MGDFAPLRVHVCALHHGEARLARRLVECLRLRPDTFAVLTGPATATHAGTDAADPFAVVGCDVLLVVIGPSWLRMLGAPQRRDDHTAGGLAAGFMGSGQAPVAIVPVLVEGAVLPEPAGMPEGLAFLGCCRAVELSTVRWYSDLDELWATAHRLGRDPDPIDSTHPDRLVPSSRPGVPRRPGCPTAPAGGSGRDGHGGARGYFDWTTPLCGAVVTVLLLAVLGWALSGGHGLWGGSAPAAAALRIEPTSGPTFTRIAVSGLEACTVPHGWRIGEAHFGLHPSGATGPGPGSDSDQLPLPPGGSWRGELLVPRSASPGLHEVHAGCWGLDPEGNWTMFLEYPPLSFVVSES